MSEFGGRLYRLRNGTTARVADAYEGCIFPYSGIASDRTVVSWDKDGNCTRDSNYDLMRWIQEVSQ